MKKNTIYFSEIVMLAHESEIEKAISYFEKAANARSEGKEISANIYRVCAEKAEAKAQKLNELLVKLAKGELYNERY
jgi:hypothetical protein